VYRSPHRSITHLRLPNCGLSDRDSSLILNALVDAANSSGKSSSSSDGSSDGSGDSMSGECSSRGSSFCSRQQQHCRQQWVLLDLGHNVLEGGAACCAAALLAAEAAAGATPGAEHSAAGACSSSRSGCGSFAGQQQPTSKRLILDGNPLGASGVRILIRAIAGQPALCLDGIGLQLQDGSAAAGVGCVSSSGSGASAGASAGCLEAASSGYFLPAQQDSSSQELIQRLPAVLLHVSIAKVSLLAKERGFRASLRATETVQAFTAQVGVS
jgi:hypothetical protein